MTAQRENRLTYLSHSLARRNLDRVRAGRERVFVGDEDRDSPLRS